jgi:3D (Asp-Asp-Asp) domain-containing protein
MLQKNASLLAGFTCLIVGLTLVLTVIEERQDAKSPWDAGEWQFVEKPVETLSFPVGYFPCHLPVTVTIYHPVPGQTDSTPNIVASGKKINIKKARYYRYIAVSRDLHVRWGGPLSFGEIVYLEGAGDLSGYYIVEDTMNARFKNRVDILRSPGDPLAKFERATLVMNSHEASGMENTTWTVD